MKPPVIHAKSSTMNGNLVHQKPTSMMSPAGTGKVIVVKDVYQDEVVKMPDVINHPETTKATSLSSSSSLLSSSSAMKRNRSFQGFEHVADVLADQEQRQVSLSRSLVDIREESFDGDCSRCASPNPPKGSGLDSHDSTCNHYASRHEPKPPSSSKQQTSFTRLSRLTSRPTNIILVESASRPQNNVDASGQRNSSEEHSNNAETMTRLASPSDRREGSVSSPHTQTHALGATTTQERRGRQQVHMHKSHSQRDFTLHEKENCLPVLACTGRFFSKDTREPLLDGHDHVGSGRIVTVASREQTSTSSVMPPNGGVAGGYNGKMMRHSRSSSTVNNVAVLPPLTSGSKSSSQPNMVFLSPSTRRRERIKGLWRTLGNRVGLRKGMDVDEGCATSSAATCFNGLAWARGPGEVVRPVYERWPARRNALAEPERMCMPQETRERIQKEVETRKASIARKVSNLLTVKLGLDKEEDLMT